MWFGPIIYNIFSTLAALRMFTFSSLRVPKMHVGLVLPLLRSTDATFGPCLTKKWREWGPLDGQMRPKASKIPPKMHLKMRLGERWSPRGCPGYPPNLKISQKHLQTATISTHSQHPWPIMLHVLNDSLASFPDIRCRKYYTHMPRLG